MKYEKWIVLPKATDSEIAELGLGGVESTLLVHRGIYTEDDLDEFLSPTLSSVHDPFLLPDMSNSVDRLIQAVDSNETVGVFGDFDTDGISGTALLTRGLENLGLKVFPYVPHRVDEGHGISPQSLEFFSSQGVTLLITVDCGVTSIDEIQTALDMGIETIVTDHHTALDGMPHAIGIVNPSLPNSSYPFKYLTGVGTAFKVMQALYLRKKIELPDELYVYVTLGTISDVGLMRDENRYLVSKGMDVLRKSELVSLDAWIKVANASKKNLSTQDMSFGIIPRINVAG
ncbi:MAG TPA: DHH family phosphoesterase, partial [SAR202 cluster bacterium]|nr:DHH family phosphoesterase [SAR202 cluster bacterium]